MGISTAPKFQGNCDVTYNIKKLTTSDQDVKDIQPSDFTVQTFLPK